LCFVQDISHCAVLLVLVIHTPSYSMLTDREDYNVAHQLHKSVSGHGKVLMSSHRRTWPCDKTGSSGQTVK